MKPISYEVNIVENAMVHLNPSVLIMLHIDTVK